MFFEFLKAVITLDLDWFVWVFCNNLHYLFLLTALCFFFFGPKVKKTAVATFLVCLMAWYWVDFELLSGWLLFVGGFLALYYITKIAVLTFANDIPVLKNNLVIVSEAQFLSILIIYNFALR